MAGYEMFAPFYDAIQGDRAGHAAYLRGLIERHHPGARRILELACGTGSILKQLQDTYQVTGLDRSEKMLAIATEKVPEARLVAGDMTEFDVGETFDVVLCVYDSINHLLTFDQWQSVFERAHAHLAKNGILVFDINTQLRLTSLARQPPATSWFGEGNLLVLDVRPHEHEGVVWDIKVFEHVTGDEYRLHGEEIREVSFPVEQIRASLRERYRRVRVYDQERARPSARSGRLHFVSTR